MPVDLNIVLPAEDRRVDLFLLQWHTPNPLAGGNVRRATLPETAIRLGQIEAFRDWLNQGYGDGHSTRPVFIAMPELSVPVGAVDALQEIVQNFTRPVVLVAGMEYVDWDTYQGMLADGTAGRDAQGNRTRPGE